MPLLKATGAPFHITGGLAAHLYGAQRAINDIDIDLPRTAIDALTGAVSQHIDFGPERYADSTWNVFLLALTYNGQAIDLTAAEDAYIYSKLTRRWESLEIQLNDVTWVEAFEHRLPLQHPLDMIRYKSKIEYDEAKHLEDVAAITAYVENTKSV